MNPADERLTSKDERAVTEQRLEQVKSLFDGPRVVAGTLRLEQGELASLQQREVRGLFP